MPLLSYIDGAGALRALLAGVAGVSLWTLWRRVARDGDPAARCIVAAGFLVRAVAGVALFWLSWLRLPAVASRTLGEGFWSFAPDSAYYVPLASAATDRGLFALFTLDRAKWSSVSFVQILGLAEVLFGDVASVGLLLNSACFLGGALLLVRWSASLGRAGRWPGLFALAVLSFQPSWILWSTQPLKDSLTGLLVIGWFFASRFFFDAEGAPGAGWRRVLGALLLAAILYELAGIRAYFAFILLTSFGAGLVLSLLQASPVRRWRRFAAGVSVWILLSHVVVWSGGALLPPAARVLLVPYEAGFGEIGEQARSGFFGPLDAFRGGFVSSGGASQIKGAGADDWSRNLLTGILATFLPHAVGKGLGLFSIGSGGGAWAFVEFDTVFFLFAALLSGLLTARAVWRGRRVTPLALQALLSALLVAACLAYVVTNFGTLFRLREMILMPLSLAPLAATLGSAREQETAARSPA